MHESPSRPSPAPFPSARCALRLGVVVLGALLVFPARPELPWSGLPVDPHWQVVLHHAFEKGWTFGRDVVFTFGPLGFLDARAPVAGALPYYVVADLATAAFLLGVVATAVRRLGRPSRLGLLLLACFTFGAYRSPPHLSLLCLPAFLFPALAYLESGRTAWLAAAGMVAVLAFHVKINAAFVLGALFLGLVLVELVRAEQRRGILVASGACGLAFLASLVFLPVDPLGYVRSGLHFVAAYPETMYLPPRGIEHRLWMAVLTLGAVAALLLVHVRRLLASPRHALGAGLVAAALFVLFKQGFVRADLVPLHVPAYMQFSLLVLGVWLLFAPAFLRRGVAAIVVLALAFSFAPHAEQLRPETLWQRIQRPVAYVQEAFGEDRSSRARFPVSRAALPLSLRHRIGGASVDVMSFESALPLLEGLDYRPRPLLQSYAALDSYLDELNARLYRSDAAPRFVLFAAATIDDRYPMFDESATRLALLQHYDVVDEGSQFVLLERVRPPRRIVRRDLGSGRGQIGSPLRVPGGEGLVSLRAEIRYSLLGRLSLLLYQPPPLSLTFLLEGGRSRTYRLPRPLVEGGIFVNHFVATRDHAEAFLERRFGALPRVRAVRLETSARWGFQPRFDYRFEEVRLAGPGAEQAPAAVRSSRATKWALQRRSGEPSSRLSRPPRSRRSPAGVKSGRNVR